MVFEMVFDNKTFNFKTFSPTLNRCRTTIDHLVETIHTSYVGRHQVVVALGFTEEAYFALLESLKDVPIGFDPEGLYYFLLIEI
jgi:hypothetical protein